MTIHPIFREGWNTKVPITVGFFSYTPVGTGVNASVTLNWEDAFVPIPPLPDRWSKTLLPSLNELYKGIASSGLLAIKLYPKAHLSAGLALGYQFRSTTGFQFEIEQITDGQVAWWRSNAPVVEDSLLNVRCDMVDPSGTDVSLELSINNPASEAAERFITHPQHGLSIGKRIRCVPLSGTGQSAVKNDAQAVALARQVATIIRDVRKELPTATIHLFAAVPFALAVFIGMHLNRLVPIQCYEHKTPERIYLPSCRLE